MGSWCVVGHLFHDRHCEIIVKANAHFNPFGTSMSVSVMQSLVPKSRYGT